MQVFREITQQSSDIPISRKIPLSTFYIKHFYVKTQLFFREIDFTKFLFQMNSKKGRQVDSSIAQAYIQLIRHAEHFIYIENQYFLGSAYCWNHNDEVNCNHTIPAEITQHIIEKIHANQRFTAYVMIPMFPEGDPASAPIQEILYWQFKTIEMMYKRIGEAILQCNSQSHPTDWLLFLCPGKIIVPFKNTRKNAKENL